MEGSSGGVPLNGTPGWVHWRGPVLGVTWILSAGASPLEGFHCRDTLKGVS
jgi:hypothetical protein